VPAIDLAACNENGEAYAVVVSLFSVGTATLALSAALRRTEDSIVIVMLVLLSLELQHPNQKTTTTT
jgi:hypothetical protein